jgi:ArsR family transcriptional regulator
MRNISRLFKALSDPNRLRILKMLEFKSLCVCEITAALQLATSTVSKHLSILRDAGFIMDLKNGKWVNYTLHPENRAAALFPLLSGWLQTDSTVQSDRDNLKNIDRNEICKLSCIA